MYYNLNNSTHWTNGVNPSVFDTNVDFDKFLDKMVEWVLAETYSILPDNLDNKGNVHTISHSQRREETNKANKRKKKEAEERKKNKEKATLEELKKAKKRQQKKVDKKKNNYPWKK